MEKGATEVPAIVPTDDLVAQEYQLLHQGAVLIEAEGRLRMRFEGARAAEVVNGLVTNDVAALAPGQGQYAAALTPKGKILADLRVFRTADGVLVDVSSRARTGFADMVRKYVNPRIAKYRDVTSEGAAIEIFGAEAEGVIARAAGLSEKSLGIDADYDHRELNLDGVRATVARIPDAGVAGFTMLVPTEALTLVADLLKAHGARRVTQSVVDIARMEAGRATWGIEMDDSTLVQEANLDELSAISFEKGCYTGQETVARVHFRGRVNRHLRGLRLDRPGVPSGAELWLSDGEKQVGDVRSTVVSPRFGPIALAMVRREVGEGDELVVRWEGGETRGAVHKLPFA